MGAHLNNYSHLFEIQVELGVLHFYLATCSLLLSNQQSLNSNLISCFQSNGPQTQPPMGKSPLLLHLRVSEYFNELDVVEFLFCFWSGARCHLRLMVLQELVE